MHFFLKLFQKKNICKAMKKLLMFFAIERLGFYCFSIGHFDDNNQDDQVHHEKKMIIHRIKHYNAIESLQQRCWQCSPCLILKGFKLKICFKNVSSKSYHPYIH